MENSPCSRVLNLLVTAKNLSESLVAHGCGHMRTVDARAESHQRDSAKHSSDGTNIKIRLIIVLPIQAFELRLLSLPDLRSTDVMTPKPILLCGKSAQIAALFSQLMLPEFQGMSGY